MILPQCYSQSRWRSIYIQCMNGIQGKKSFGWKWNRLLDTVVTILKYKKRQTYHAIYIKFFSERTVSYITVSDYDVLNITNNGTGFTGLTRVSEEDFEMKSQEGSILKHPIIRIF